MPRRENYTRTLVQYLLVLLGFALLLSSCGNGESGSVSPVTEPSLRTTEQAVQTLLDLYSTALSQEDIDRLQELLPFTNASALSRLQRQTQDSTFIDAETFRQNMSEAFRLFAFLDLRILETDIQAETEPPSVTFLALESVLDPSRLEQRTRAFRTTFRLTRRVTPSANEAENSTTFLITAVAQEEPQFEILTPGQIVAETPTRIMVSAPSGTFPLSAATVEVPDTGDVQSLAATAGAFEGVFTPPAARQPQPLRIRLHGVNGEEREIFHRYRLRLPSDGVVQKIAGTGSTQFLAIAMAPDGTVTGGGKEPPFGATLYQVPPGATTACVVASPFSSTNPDSQVQALVYDNLGRLHTIVFDKGSEDPTGPRAITGDLVIDADDVDGDLFILCKEVNPNIERIFCQTVNPFLEGGQLDPDYPFLIRDPETGKLEPSASTRVVAAGGGDVWLFGSDGGVARVADNFRELQCPEQAIEVQYDPIFRRQDSDLLSNSVPAFVVGNDGALGFGTALGFTRLQDGQFAAVPFQRQLSLPQDIDTLEAFFQEIANAIFDARPLATEGIGEVSFREILGDSVIKENLIFAAVEEVHVQESAPRRIWLGTLGGGLRRLEARGEAFRDTLLLTRAEVVRIDPQSGNRTVILSPGIGSNIIFALAVDDTQTTTDEEDDTQTIWAATDEGISQIDVVNETVTITNFSALDGVGQPVRDVVAAEGTVWLATDTGLFRIVP